MDKKQVLKWGLGVIASYLLCELFLRPIISIASNYSGTIIDSVVNYYYRLCATSNTSTLIVEIAIYGSCFMCLSPVLASIFDIKSSKSDMKKLIKYKNILTSNQQFLESNADNEQSEEDDLLKTIDDLTIKNKTIVKKAIVIIVLGTILFLSVIFLKIAPCAQRSYFDEAVIKITPYLKQDEVNMLKSDWTRMKTKQDYIEINDFIKVVIKNNNLH